MADVAVPSIATATPVAADSVLGVVAASGAVKRFAASPPFSQLAATTGANLLGYSAVEVYDAGTVGAALQAAGTGSGTGDVVGPASAVSGHVALFSGTTGKLLSDSGVALSGSNTGDQTISLTGDVTGSGTGSFAATLATVNANVGAFTNANITVNAKGQITAAANGVGGSGGGDALTTNPLSQFAATTSLQLKGVISDETGSGALVFATSPALVTPDLGTPSAVVLTNATGTAASLTAGHVTTNANLTGDVTSSGNAATVVKINGTSLAGLATGILKNTTTTGVPSIAIAADFPTLNQNTSGSAATLTTPRAIYGNNFDGSAALTQIIASTFGGTGNGFTKFSGPATAEKTFTLPNASAAVLTDNAAVTVAQGGTGLATLTTGNVILGAGTSTPTFVAPSTSGNVLTSNGTAWTSAAPAGGGAWTLLSTVTASGVATADVDTTFSSTYDHYFIIVDGIAVSVDGDAIWARLKLSGTYATADYKYHLNKSGDGATTYSGAASSSAAQIVLCNNVGSNPVWSANLTMQVLKPSGTAFRKSVHWAGVVPGTASGNMETASGVGMHNNSTSAITGVRFMASTGNITGVFRLYGVTN